MSDDAASNGQHNGQHESAARHYQDEQGKPPPRWYDGLFWRLSVLRRADSDTDSHTLQIGEARQPLIVAGLDCPSWARSRTLLIQRGHCNTQIQATCNHLPSSCHPMLEFAGFNAGLCRPFSLKCRSLAPRPASSCRIGAHWRSQWQIAGHASSMWEGEAPRIAIAWTLHRRLNKSPPLSADPPSVLK